MCKYKLYYYKMQYFILLLYFFEYLSAVDFDIDYESSIDDSNLKESDNSPPQHLTVVNRTEVRRNAIFNVDCDSFGAYASNCTKAAAMIYTSSSKSPPPPSMMKEWCKALNHLLSCAQKWNEECEAVTDSRFNHESINGHAHVVSNICENKVFLTQYSAILMSCIQSISAPWEACYMDFKSTVDKHKNTTDEWTHFQIHFQLCCARAKFRRCTLDVLFRTAKYLISCSHNQALVLQKFSVVVSEGDVYQNCDDNIIYSNCPGGDPRPSERELAMVLRQTQPDTTSRGEKTKHSHTVSLSTITFGFLIYLFC